MTTNKIHIRKQRKQSSSDVTGKTLQRGTTEGGIRGCDVADTLHDRINRGRGNEAAGRSTINRSEEVLNWFVTSKDVCTAGAKRLGHNAHTRTIGVVTPSIRPSPVVDSSHRRPWHGIDSRLCQPVDGGSVKWLPILIPSTKQRIKA